MPKTVASMNAVVQYIAPFALSYNLPMHYTGVAQLVDDGTSARVQQCAYAADSIAPFCMMVLVFVLDQRFAVKPLTIIATSYFSSGIVVSKQFRESSGEAQSVGKVHLHFN
jgi:hypothetical protein